MVQLVHIKCTFICLFGGGVPLPNALIFASQFSLWSNSLTGRRHWPVCG